MDTNLKIRLKSPVCAEGLSEDAQREFVGSLEITSTEDGSVYVVSIGGVPVKFDFGSDGNFSGVVANIAGKAVKIIPGIHDNALQIFKGFPTSTFPGIGWEVEPELTQEVLGQPANQNDWKVFFARQVAVINTF